MKLYAPEYYLKFKCIADRCRHSCCVGWEIGVDADTLARWRELPTVGEEMLSHVGDEGTITLCQNGRCPFLDDAGLCRMISAHGDSMIPAICREHPRFYMQAGDRVEMGIGAVCEEACRLILTEPTLPLVCIGEREWDESAAEYDAVSQRDLILSTVSRDDLTYTEMLGGLLRDYSIPASAVEPRTYAECIAELELLYEEDRAVLTSDGRAEWAEVYLRRFLSYLVYRHVTEADSADNLRARLAFCILLTRMLEGASKDTDLDGLLLRARTVSEEIEYSEDNTAALIFEAECQM